jgi:hyperosmotically inducible periplasmic protein
MRLLLITLTALMLAAMPAAAQQQVEQDIQDSATTARVKSKLLVEGRLSPFDINTTTVENVVTLTGAVHTEPQKLLAEDIARSVPGVEDVVNNIHVMSGAYGQPDTRNFRDKMRDGKIAAAIRARLVASGQFKGLRIGIEVIDGVVLFSGIVGTEEQKERIEEIAMKSNGVRRIVNNLLVRPKEPMDPIKNIGRQLSDEWVEKRVEMAILTNRHVSIREVNVEVDDDIVILTGYVADEEQRAFAEELARSVGGVKEVENHILLRPPDLETAGVPNTVRPPEGEQEPPLLEPIDPVE